MKLENNIGWTDCTANAVIGCAKVSPGCQFCYAERDTPARVLRSKGIETWGPNGVRHPVAGFEAKVRRLNKLCICDKCHVPAGFDFVNGACFYRPDSTHQTQICDGTFRRIRLFADSNSDFLDDRWPVETLARFLKAIHDAPNVDFQLLTKRPENWRRRLEEVGKLWVCDGSYRETPEAICYHDRICPWRAGHTPPNIWLGVSCENQELADRRIPELLKIPAKVRFVSAEPLLGPINFYQAAGPQNEGQWMNQVECGRIIHQIIIGGESGPHSRWCSMEWIRDIVRQCKEAQVPCYVKQLGSNARRGGEDESETKMSLDDKKGADMTEWPEDLRVRQFPK